jgi:hypothetical protein
MATFPDPATAVPALQDTLHATAQNLLHRLYGADGPPWETRFTDLDDLAVQVNQALARELLAQGLHRHADQRPDPTTCPSCGGPLASADPEARVLTTWAGEIAWTEPHATCGRCRRAFSPSGRALGPGHG